MGFCGVVVVVVGSGCSGEGNEDDSVVDEIGDNDSEAVTGDNEGEVGEVVGVLVTTTDEGAVIGTNVVLIGAGRFLARILILRGRGNDGEVDGDGACSCDSVFNVDEEFWLLLKNRIINELLFATSILRSSSSIFSPSRSCVPVS